MRAAPSLPAIRLCLVVARSAAIIVFVLGFEALLGWSFDVGIFRSTAPAGIIMKANTAIGLSLAGLTLWLRRRPGNTALWQRRLGGGLAVFLGLLGGLTFLQHLTGWNFGIDELFFRDAPGAVATTSPGRMGPPASLGFLLAALALFSANGGSWSKDLLAHIMGLAICALSLLALVGYLFGVDQLYGLARYTGIALNTAISLLCLGIGIVLSRPNTGLMSIICADDAGGAMARRLALPTFILPIIIWWVRLYAEEMNWIDASLARPLFILVLSVCSILVLLINAERMSVIEQKRLRSEDERHRAFARTTDILESIDDAFYSIDAQGRFTYLNHQAEKLWGLSRPKLIGQSLWTDFPDLADPVSAAAHREVLAQRHARSYEYFNAASGRWFDVRLFPEAGDGLSAFVRDVTERKTSEVELRRAMETAEKASQAKTEFLATLSHEMRTPLNPVLLTLDNLEAHPLFPAELRDDIASMRRNVDLETRLISDLLDITRIETGKFLLNTTEVDLHAVVADVATMCRRSDGPRIHLELEAAAHDVSGDPVRLHQLVWNLLTNAQKFTDPDGLVTLRTSSPRPASVRLEVVDTGCGIAPETMPRLFNAFEQGSSRTARQRSGLGLGLSIARKIATAHGGSIAVESDGVGKGAKFVVDLATLTPTSAAPVATAITARPKEVNDINWKVLLVEDHEPSLQAMVQLLKRAGHHVTAAGTCRAAEDAARTGSFDLLISDVGLPDGSGLDLMRQLRPQFEGRAIALTGYGTEADVTAAHAAGFAAHLTKPIKKAQLTEVLLQIATRR